MAHAKKKRAVFRVRTCIQALSLIVFLALLCLAAFPLAAWWVPVDIFLRLDPLVATLVPVAARDWTSLLAEGLGAGLGVLLVTAVWGRLFCGYICPMGITLDMMRAIGFVFGRRPTRRAIPAGLIYVKYFFLTTLAAAALCGVNHVFWGSPIALVTRFYALLVHPLVLFGAHEGLSWARVLLDGTVFAYAHVAPRMFRSVYFVAAFFISLALLERIRPRFWCRFLCPAGALLALVSWRSFRKRRAEDCHECGACVQACPMGAIAPDVYGSATRTRHVECIACETCVAICPTESVYFSVKNEMTVANVATRETAVSPHTRRPVFAHDVVPRRIFLQGTLAGASLAGLAVVNASSFVTGIGAEKRGTSAQAGCVRPPGARPEADFLTRCVRCGECMKACPTNGLQPSFFVAGFEGIFSPVLMPRIGGCEPECQVCGEVCPTGAIIPLPLEDKRQAKIGTAVVYPELCLAWAEGRSCVVCQEVCPYGAVKIEKKQGSVVPVPVIYARRCFGCGFCECHCPVHLPAIVVQPLNALRLQKNTYAHEARMAGLDLVPVSLRSQEAHDASQDVLPEGALPPGFTD